ncbi:hypothetical protein ACFSJW_13500 [Flavobacterium artemisiae]|uniref:Uncharacterized protein n=1 Tax=Flavobacterium artemisiae TaxID=2126556 RepID=A0ABW4HG92_9FLAO
MENTDHTYNDDIQKCPYHAAMKALHQNPPEKSENKDADSNTGKWDEQRNSAGRDDSGSTESVSSNSKNTFEV